MSRALVYRCLWIFSGGSVALLLLNNHNLLTFGGNGVQFYDWWLVGIWTFGASAYLCLSFIFPKLFFPTLLQSRAAEVIRSATTISFLAIHGTYFYKSGLIAASTLPYQLTIALVITLAATYAVWLCFGLLFRGIAQFMRFLRLSREEYIVLSGFTIFSTIITLLTNFLTTIFYQLDAVFSLDTGDQLARNIINNTYTSYTGVRHIGESIITSPIGAVSTPLHDLLWFIPNGQYVIPMGVFSLLIALSAILIARMLQLQDRPSRLAFYILYLFSFPVILFSSMFEQYVPSVFLIIMCAFFLWTDQKRRPSVSYTAIPQKYHNLIAIACLVLSGMGILTSLAGGILFLQRNLKATLKSIVGIIATLILFILASGQLLTVVYGYQEYIQLQSFSGLGLSERINIYSHFVVNTITTTSISFEKVLYGNGIGVIDSHDTITSFNIFGLALFCVILAGIAVGIHRKQLISIVSGVWILLSIAVLVGFGWGASNNESTLYSYYFSFAFVVGLFNFFMCLVELLHRLLHIRKHHLHSALIACALVVVGINAIQYSRIVHFGITHYPVNVRDFAQNVTTPN